MGGPRDRHTKSSKSYRERQTLYDITYMCNLKNELIYKTNILTNLEHKFMVTKRIDGLEVEGNKNKLGVRD